GRRPARRRILPLALRGRRGQILRRPARTAAHPLAAQAVARPHGRRQRRLRPHRARPQRRASGTRPDHVEARPELLPRPLRASRRARDRIASDVRGAGREGATMLQPRYFAPLAEQCRTLRADPEYVAKYSQLPYDGRLLVNMFEGNYSMEAIIDFFAWRFHTG